MKRIIAAFSVSQVRTAVAAVLFETLGKSRVVASLAVVAILLYAAGALQLVSPGPVWAAASGVTSALIGWILVLLLLYFVNVRFAMRTYRTMASGNVTYELSEEGCTVSSNGWTRFLAWSSLARVVRYPGVWLLEIKEARSQREVIDSFKNILRTTQNVAEAQRDAGVFPVVWAQPIPLRSFLVLPANKFDEENISFIRSIVKSGERKKARDL